MLLRCENCNQVSFDLDAQQCRSCGTVGTSDLTVDERALTGLLQNAQIRLFGLRPDSFQQILGLFGPRVAVASDTGIPFTEETSRLARDHLRKHDILCARVRMTKGGRTDISLVIGTGQQGIDAGIKQARRLAKKLPAKLTVD